MSFIKTQRYRMKRHAKAFGDWNRPVDPLYPRVFFSSLCRVYSEPRFSEAHPPLSLSLVVQESQPLCTRPPT